MPWHPFTSPAALWAVQPSFVVGQALFISCAIIALIHAWRLRAQGQGSAWLLIWVGALVAGTANDLIFMALPLVDNFWHAQANVMLTARLPLYIPCVYVCFMYYPTVAVRRLRLRAIPQAALTGLVAILFYAPYDITGAKLLWWTWHDTDLTIFQRVLGAPASSTLWVLTFSASFAWLIDRIIRRDEAVSGKTFAIGLAVLGGLTSIVMVIQMTVLQQLDPLLGLKGTPGHAALIAGIFIYAALAWRGRRVTGSAPAQSTVEPPAQSTAESTAEPPAQSTAESTAEPPAQSTAESTAEATAEATGHAPAQLSAKSTSQPTAEPTLAGDRLLFGALAAHFIVFAAIMALSNPATHRSTGVHQTVGPCYVEAKDITGLIRHEYLCAEDFNEDFDFSCADKPAHNTRWYTLCGRPHQNFPLWLGAISALGLLGIAVFARLLGFGPFRRLRA